MFQSVAADAAEIAAAEVDDPYAYDAEDAEELAADADDTDVAEADFALSASAWAPLVYAVFAAVNVDYAFINAVAAF